MTSPATRNQTSSAPARWDPFREFEDLQRRMGSLLESTFAPSAAGQRQNFGGVWLPLADVSETDDAYIVEIDLPGVKRDDVDVQLDGNELAVTGEFKEREREGMFRHRTRRLGRFEFRMTVPRDIDADKIDAGLDDGVLTIRIPKTDKAKPRRVEIGRK